MDLREILGRCLGGRVCFVGLGNPEFGDDGFGVRLAERLAGAGTLEVVVAGTCPERVLGAVARRSPDAVVFLDAVDFGGEPGSVVLLSRDQMMERFPQVSTHRMALGTLALWMESSGARAWLLGVQPESLAAGSGLRPRVAGSLESLAAILTDAAAAIRPGEQS